MNILSFADQLQNFLERDKPIFLCFMAQWCGDCHFIHPFLQELEEKYSDEVDFLSIDIDDFPDLARRYKVDGIPSFFFFYRNQTVSSLVNSRRKTEQEVNDFFEQALLIIKEE